LVQEEDDAIAFVEQIVNIYRSRSGGKEIHLWCSFIKFNLL